MWIDPHCKPARLERPQFQDLLKQFTLINIKTLVYFNLEATGLKSAGSTRISEIAFVAVNFEELHMKIQNQLKNKNNQDYCKEETTRG